MTVLKDLSLIWAMLHTLILFLTLFESRYPRKKTMTLSLITMLPLSVINLFLYAILGIERYGTLMLLTLSLPSCIFFWFISRYRDGRFFFTFCVVDTTVLEILYITNILSHYLTPDSYLLMFLVRLIAYPLISFITYTKLRPIYLEVQRQGQRGWGIFAAIGALFYIAITLMMTYPTPITQRPEYLPVMFILFLLMPIVYVDIILTLRQQKMMYEASERESIMNVQVASVVSHVEELREANESFRKERHDFRHKLKTIAGLVESKNYEELEMVVDEYLDGIEKTVVTRYCKSAVIDAVLSVYLRKATQSGIQTKIDIAFPETYEASPTELATALANAIENAIQACEKLPKEERFLEIKVLCDPNFMIMIRNSFNGHVFFDENGIPQSTKEEHGFGTRSIATFCEKNGGYYRFKAEEKVFTLFMHLK